jgi:phage regulator Rha-like protein
MTDLNVITRNEVLVVDSRLIAIELGIQHRNLIATIKKYSDDFKEIGVLLFETEKPTDSTQGGRPEVFCYLNEAQSTYLMTLSKNTEQVRHCKKNLVIAFEKAKKLLSQQTSQPKALPSSIEYAKAFNDLQSAPDSKLKRLIEFAMISELEFANVNNRLLTGTTEQKHYVPVNIRASQLGYSKLQIDTATQLGKFVKNRLTPSFRDWQGQYLVWHYELNNELDNVIHLFFANN